MTKPKIAYGLVLAKIDKQEAGDTFFLRWTRRVQLSLRPNPQPLPYKGRGARIKAYRPFGERNESGVSRIS
jgi:hypothetical protein